MSQNNYLRAQKKKWEDLNEFSMHQMFLELKRHFLQVYQRNLSEKQMRHFLGQEYLELGKGSQRYIAEVFGCSRQTIKKGAMEVSHPDFQADYTRQRMKGGGRKKKK